MVGSYKEKTDDKENKLNRIIPDERIIRFGERLREAMKGESNNSFAKRCGMSERVIRNYLDGSTYPSIDRLAVLAKASNTSLEWLATGQDASTKNANSVLYTKRDEQSSPSPKQQQAWFEILERMTPGERESVIDRVFRHGINALLTPPQSDIQQESQFPWPEDLPAKLGVSNNSLAFAQLYASLTDEQRQRFLESINDKEHIPANHNKMSSKAG
ncbi:Bacteriophage CI repressor helix-turn-helix domain protein [Photorhabdus australis subsp. thailandensis]|uniref:Bacteriophage CI repressor helix-turn-helix domain protein n=1 Tax=Photorhabdus australis subsp. thailandensis TaxID=2805096 RepID=A0A1C0TZ85_9GAMM|nr:helix-turn-helix transcriptional regulator [Photorhabdus australis]OCQ50985.1 Bacteriophage CI repressor helix-turn-helix domain protein [Photorhabdus australis subsp. thailandensis]